MVFLLQQHVLLRLPRLAHVDSLANHGLDHLLLAFGVGRVTDGVGKLEVLILEHARLGVRESVKGLFAVIRAHARGPDTTKGQLSNGKVHQTVVGYESARRSLHRDTIDHLFVVGERIQGQRLVAVQKIRNLRIRKRKKK